VVISGLATNQPELLFNGMQGNALDFPGMKQCTPIWAIFPHLFSYSIASSFFTSSCMFTRCISFTVMLRTESECGHRLMWLAKVLP
jgi:hypothetical protein